MQVPSAPSGRWLSFARVAWLAVAILTLGLDAAGIPYAYARYKSVCTGAACDDVDRLTPERLQALHELGLSAGFFAAYDVAVLVVVTLTFAAVADVIFWRGSNDRMTLFTSFTLLVFGGAALSSGIPQALEGFSARLRDQTDLNDLQETMVRVVEETVQPQHVSLWLRSLERHR